MTNQYKLPLGGGHVSHPADFKGVWAKCETCFGDSHGRFCAGCNSNGELFVSVSSLLEFTVDVGVGA